MRDAARWIAVIAVAVGVLVLCVSVPVLAQTPTVSRVASVSSVSSGTIESFVQDETGAPVVGAVVSAMGASSAFGVTDRFGRATLRSLTPGPYIIRAYITGFATPRGQMVQVLASTRASSSIALRRVTAVTPTTSSGSVPPVLAASAGGFGDAVEQPAPVEPAETRSGDTGSVTNDSETAWRLRHARRSILNDAVDQVMVADASPAPGTNGFGERARPVSSTVSGAAHAATNFFAETPFYGQVNL